MVLQGSDQDELNLNGLKKEKPPEESPLEVLDLLMPSRVKVLLLFEHVFLYTRIHFDRDNSYLRNLLPIACL